MIGLANEYRLLELEKSKFQQSRVNTCTLTLNLVDWKIDERIDEGINHERIDERIYVSNVRTRIYIYICGTD